MSENKKYTIEDIKLYLKGKLSPSEMHALEKAAMDDPFLADAIEGMQVYKQSKDIESFQSDITLLDQRLNERTNTGKKINSIWWKIAAIFIIVITGVAIIFITAEKNRIINPEIAKTEKEKEIKQKQSEMPAVDSASVVVKEYAPGNAVVSSGIKDSHAVAKTREKVPSTSQKQSDVSHDEEEVKAVTSVPSRNEEPLHAKIDSAQADKSGEDKQPVAKALEGRAAGVDIQSKKQSDSDTTRIDAADASLDEVVVTAYAISGKRKANNYSKPLSEQRSRKRIMPEGGWDNFERYIKNNVHVSPADSVITGIERFTFMVDEEGRPDSINILNSLSPAHDAEVIRLLDEGPAWKILMGKNRYLTVSIIF